MKLFITSLTIILASCSGPVKPISVKTIYSYQGEETGKQYQYAHKASVLNEKKTINAFSLSVFNTEHYFDNESSKHFEISYDYAFTYNSMILGINAFAYKGSMDINTEINEKKYDRVLNYNGYGTRLNFSPRYVLGDYSIYPFSLQFGLTYESGDYYKWRKSLSKDFENFKNFDSDEWTYSMYYVPEIQYNWDELTDFSIFAGIGKYYNNEENAHSSLFGFMIRYKSTAISWSQSRMEYDHIVYEGPVDRPDNVAIAKIQDRFMISYLF